MNMVQAANTIAIPIKVLMMFTVSVIGIDSLGFRFGQWLVFFLLVLLMLYILL